jgi:carbohydrate-binding DOMON domain-containing protein
MPGGHENEETQFFERQLTSICKKFAFLTQKKWGLNKTYCAAIFPADIPKSVRTTRTYGVTSFWMNTCKRVFRAKDSGVPSYKRRHRPP